MGIKNLFYNLPSLSKERPLSDFANKRIGIDASAWIFQAYHSQFNSDGWQNVIGLIRLFDRRMQILEKNKLEVHSSVHFCFRWKKAPLEESAEYG